MNENDYLLFLYMLIIGAIASFIQNTKRRARTFLHYFLFWICGAVSSSFLCWLAYEVAFYFSTDLHFSLAIGGVAAWQGTKNVETLLKDFINYKIIKKGNSDDENK